MATPSNVPRRTPNSQMATQQYMTRKAYEKKPYSKKTSKSSRYNKYPVVYPRSQALVSRARAPPRVAMKISDCAMRYMATVCNPFSAEPGACVPCDLFPLPSQKFRAFTRGTFNLGTTGFGFIIVNPNAASDKESCVFTTSSSVMTSSTLFNAATITGLAVMPSIPYNNSQLTTAGSVQARIVACGVRVRYAGTESGRSGTIVTYEDQDHAPVGGLTFLSVQQQPSSVVVRPSGDGTWDATVCSSGPVTPQELEFQSLAYPNSGVQTAIGGGYMVIAIQGIASDAYNFEVYSHIEYIGQNVAAKTPSHADTDQYGKIIQSVKEVSAVNPVTPASGPSIFERFAAKVSQSLPKLIDAGVGAARAFAGDATGYAQLIGAASSIVFGQSPQAIEAPMPRMRLTERQRQIMAA